MANQNIRRNAVQQDDFIDILAFLQFLQKRVKLLTVGLIIGALAGWALSSFVIPQKYMSYVDQRRIRWNTTISMRRRSWPVPMW